MTPFNIQCEILADLWMNFRNDEEFTDFIEYNDLGLPLSYAVINDIVKANTHGEELIKETFDLLLSGMGLEDTGFVDLDDLFGAGGYEVDED